MPKLQSQLFRDDPKLQACLANDAAHVTLKSTGLHVRKIQYAVLVLTGKQLPSSELDRDFYGPATARLVKEYKTRRRIINHAYQSTADDIVGKLTIAALDAEMVAVEAAERLAALRPKLPLVEI